MAFTTGVVRCVFTADDSGFTTITDNQTATNETLVLWFAPREITEFTRVLHSMWISQLREAMAGGIQVTLAHGDNDATVTSVQLGVVP
jgi:hypothetical protein